MLDDRAHGRGEDDPRGRRGMMVQCSQLLLTSPSWLVMLAASR